MKKGFTFIELVFVMVLMGILLAVMVPVYGSFLSFRKMDKNARELLSDLRWAREQSLTKRLNTVVTFCTEDNSYNIASIRLQRHLQCDMVSVSPSSQLTFYSDGTASDSVSVVLSDRSGKSVTVNVSGETGYISVL